MKIYANRDIKSEEYKVSKINQLMGKDLWVLADYISHKHGHVKLYIKFIKWEYDRILMKYDRIFMDFISYDSLVRGVYGLYKDEEIYGMLSGENRFASFVDEIDTDFSEVYTGQELYDMIRNTPYLPHVM